MHDLRVMIFGATGTAGSAVLQICLHTPAISEVCVISRRSTGITDPKLREIIHDDFGKLDGLRAHFTGLDACLYCLGVSQTLVKEEDLFYRITHDYPLAAATILKRESPDCAFCFLSGQGADRTGKSRIRFAKAKGMAENSLIALSLRHLFIFRPGYIHPTGTRSGRPLGERISGILFPLLVKVLPQFVIRAEELARGMLSVACTLPDQQLFDNNAIKSRSYQANIS